MKLSLAVSAVSLACLTLFAPGCAVDEAEVQDDETSEADATGSTALLIATDADGTRVTLGKGEAHTCEPAFHGNLGDRWTCRAGKSQLDVLLRSTKDVGLVAYAKGRGADHPTFSSCKITKGSLSAPERLSCTPSKLRDKSHGSGLVSPFDPSLKGFTLPNAHQIDAKGLLIRGMTPRLDEDFDALAAAGVTRVLVFKNSTAQDDTTEELERFALPKDATKVVPFPWKSMPAFTTSCRMALEGLRFLQEGVKAKKKTFFHCTVGEDRTGTLAALHHMVQDGEKPVDAFQQNACENGYGAGNPTKPGFVVGELARGLSPLARKLGYLVASGKIDAKLDDAACAVDPENDPAFEGDPDFSEEAWTCGTSTRFVP